MCALVTGVQTCALPISWRRRQRRHRRWRVPRIVSETHAMSRILALLYGAACYAVFLAPFLYAIAFVTGVGVPKHVDSGTPNNRKGVGSGKGVSVREDMGARCVITSK